MSTDPLFDPQYDADHIGEIIDGMKKSGYDYDESASRSAGVPVFLKDGRTVSFKDWDDACERAESCRKPEYGLGAFEVTLVRDTPDGRETEKLNVKAIGATVAYLIAMKAHNASEMWTPIAWRKLRGGNDIEQTA